eukprot:CAMPEP_0176091066 /NCGR_PEP_ID=MMETSP0120_2-20121206/45609_1 /TAXON_ID=160619 /ORGANISM="Kryptoperidinium foliaceum, Strain CCMP 1326" /LENGTH=271 /DNA_ID=CAMNT_0017424951 /DNA_START=157 /DNA_END=972 /DNA_ORIENTATION=+
MKSVDVLDETFSQQCNVMDGESAEKYGYETAAPDTNDGAEDEPANNKYGYSEAAPDFASYGYGDPDSSADKNGKYEYGDAAPDDAAKYGYGEEPDYASYGYGNAAPDYASYGYGETENSADIYGYGDPDDAAKYGYGDEDQKRPPNRSHSADSISGGRRERPRRRGSVTKYSLETAEAVKEEYEKNNEILNQYRSGSAEDPSAEDIHVSLKQDDGSRQFGRNRTMSDDSIDDMSCDNVAEKKKKKRFARLRIGRNRSGMSTGSSHSASSKN